MYKTELHCHSKEASPCSTQSVEQLVEIYSKAGYDTVVLANHFAKSVQDHYGCKSYDEYVTLFVDAFEKFKKAAEGKLKVVMGAELRFNHSINDYLWFGANEESMRKIPNIFSLNEKEFHEICKQNGWLFVQAHPFRNGMMIVNPTFLDGVEVYNGHVGHDSRNFIAKSWAKEYNLIETSGTDLHYDTVPATGGISTDFLVTDMSQIIEVLKNGKYQLLTSEIVR